MISEKQTQAIVGHIGIEVSDLRRSKKFYQALLNGLGFEVVLENVNVMGFSNQTFQIWLSKTQKQSQT